MVIILSCLSLLATVISGGIWLVLNLYTAKVICILSLLALIIFSHFLKESY